jgi:NitT/TauT family transport system permease protein
VAAGGGGLSIPEFIFPSPWQITLQFIEFKGPLLEAAWKTFWVTMLGFALSIVVGVLLGFLIGSSRLAYTALYPLMVASTPCPRRRWCPSWWCGSASAWGRASSPPS